MRCCGPSHGAQPCWGPRLLRHSFSMIVFEGYFLRDRRAIFDLGRLFRSPGDRPAHMLENHRLPRPGAHAYDTRMIAWWRREDYESARIIDRTISNLGVERTVVLGIKTRRRATAFAFLAPARRKMPSCPRIQRPNAIAKRRVASVERGTEVAG